MGTVMNDYVAVEWLDIWNTRCVNISYHTFCPFTERMMTNLIATVITCVTDYFIQNFFGFAFI